MTLNEVEALKRARRTQQSRPVEEWAKSGELVRWRYDERRHEQGRIEERRVYVKSLIDHC